MAEDDDIEQDSEAYRKWRSGNDNDKYASSKTPTESGSKSGSYSIPKADDEYALPGEDDNTGGGSGSWLDGDMTWPVLIVEFIALALVIAAVVGAVMSSTESDSKPSEWPETEGKIAYQGMNSTFIGFVYCDYKGDEVYDEKEQTFKEPNIPNNKIGIMHLAAGIWKNGVDMRVDKNIKVNIKSLEGKILEKSLRNLIK